DPGLGLRQRRAQQEPGGPHTSETEEAETRETGPRRLAAYEGGGESCGGNTGRKGRRVHVKVLSPLRDQNSSGTSDPSGLISLDAASAKTNPPGSNLMVFPDSMN